MFPDRLVRISVVTPDGELRSLREVALGVHRKGLDPDEFIVQVVPSVDHRIRASSIATTTSTPPCSYDSTDTGADNEQGDDQ
jgi:hypothetical protein